MSPCPYFEAFEEEINLQKFDLAKHKTAGLCLAHVDGQLLLGGLALSTPGTKIPRWQTRIKGARLIKVGEVTVSTIKDAQLAFQCLSDEGTPLGVLLFLHLEIQPNLTYNRLLIVSLAPFHQQVHDQLSQRWDFDAVAKHLKTAPSYKIINDGDVLNVITKVMKLTRGKLFQQDDWNDWLESEYLQLNQYHAHW